MTSENKDPGLTLMSRCGIPGTRYWILDFRCLMLEGRIGPGWDVIGARTSDEDYVALEALAEKIAEKHREAGLIG